MNNEQQLESFKQKFNRFIKSYKCQQHSKNLNIICIDTACQSRGLICSICLTINGAHKNHDAVQIFQYVGNCLKDIDQEKSIDQILDLLSRAEIIYDELLNLLTNFMDNCSKIIKGYISQRNELHEQRKREIGSTSFIKKILACDFESLAQASKLLSSFSSKYSINQLKKPLASQQKSLEKAQDYVNDLTYQSGFIGREFKKIQVRLKEILVVKQASPLVLNYEPTFHQPTLLQNSQTIYIGESKDKKPHGKGICYHLNGDRVINGSFVNGKVEGLAELYYPTGDYYLGEFKTDKKNGRGVYRWNGKECNVYEGEFKAGRRHGKGTFWWSDGSKYVGSFSEGNQTGYGTLFRARNEVEYEGFWLNGLFHGQGTQHFPNGQKFEGEFKQDKFHGDGILYKQKQTIKGRWKQNELVLVHKKPQAD